jgi:capsular exopolysaccharide synthesis family protein
MNDRFLPRNSGGSALIPADQVSDPVSWSEQEWHTHVPSLGLQNFLNALFRWRWLFLAIVVATILGAAAWASFQTPLYRATATLELNPDPAQVVQTDDKQAPDQAQSDRDFLALQLGLIKSRSVAERVARGLNLGRDTAFLRHSPSPEAGAEAAVGSLMNGFSASGTTSDRIMEVSFVHPDPRVAAKIANRFADEAIESSFERALGTTARSREFLNRRLEATRRDLEKSERALIDYARTAKIINVVSSDAPTSGDSAGGTLVASNLVALNQQLADAQNARIVAQQRYAQAGAAAQAARASDSTVQSLQQQRAQLQAQYDQKLQTFQPDYPEMKALRAQIAGLDSQIAASGSRAASTVVGSLRADMIAAQKRESALQARINQLQSQFLDLNDRGVEYTILKRSVDANRSMYNALLQQLGVENSSATRTSSISIVDTAEVPSAPFSPNVPRTLLLALIAGMLLGSAGVVGADRFYDTINTPDDLKDIGLPLLGVVPAAPKKELLDDLIADPRSPVAEAFHSARASLQFASSGGAPKTILFTSARAAEGKTSTAIAIAADFLGIGKRVVVVDADLRKPSLRGESPGLSGVLAKASTLEASLLVTDNPQLWLLPAGRLPPNPTALLEGHAIEDLLRALENRFDVVIMDGPPVLGFADAPLLSAVAEATVLVVAARSTSRSAARNAIARLQATGGKLVGGILNKFDRKAAGFGYGDTSYGYYSYEYGGRTAKRSLIAPAAVVTNEAAE